MGSLPAERHRTGDVFVSSRYYGYYYGGTTAAILRINSAGTIVQVIRFLRTPRILFPASSWIPVNNMLYARRDHQLQRLWRRAPW